MQAIAEAYTDLGQVQTITSYNSGFNPNSQTQSVADIVNQVEDAYDGWGNLTPRVAIANGRAGREHVEHAQRTIHLCRRQRRLGCGPVRSAYRSSPTPTAAK